MNTNRKKSPIASARDLSPITDVDFSAFKLQRRYRKYRIIGLRIIGPKKNAINMGENQRVWIFADIVRQ